MRHQCDERRYVHAVLKASTPFAGANRTIKHVTQHAREGINQSDKGFKFMYIRRGRALGLIFKLCYGALVMCAADAVFHKQMYIMNYYCSVYHTQTHAHT